MYIIKEFTIWISKFNWIFNKSQIFLSELRYISVIYSAMRIEYRNSIGILSERYSCTFYFKVIRKINLNNSKSSLLFPWNMMINYNLKWTYGNKKAFIVNKILKKISEFLPKFHSTYIRAEIKIEQWDRPQWRTNYLTLLEF